MHMGITKVLGVGTAAAATALLVTAAPAVAADGNTKATIYTLAHSGLCAGAIDLGVGHYPGEATLFIGGQLFGVGQCAVDVTFTFSRRGDGHTESYTRTLNGPGYVGTSKDIVGPGIGLFDVTVTSNAPSFGAAPMLIDITPYQG